MSFAAACIAGCTYTFLCIVVIYTEVKLAILGVYVVVMVKLSVFVQSFFCIVAIDNLFRGSFCNMSDIESK